MKQILSIIAALMLISSTATAQTFEMVKDINPTGDANPSTPRIEYNGKHYFVANDGIHGVELWATDGTDAGTQMVKDINPSGHAYIDYLTVHNGLLYFHADDGTHGTELWISDGTAAGTQMLKDIKPGSSGGMRYSNGFTKLNDKLYFIADGGASEQEVWVTDGTTAGTQMLLDINPEPYVSSEPEGFTVFNGKLFFSANDGIHGRELWVSDGTTAGTQVIDVIDMTVASNPVSSHPSQFTVFNNELYFTVLGRWLYKTDGTEAGTQEVKAIHATGLFSNIYSINLYRTFIRNGKLYFTARNAPSTSGWELWATDGTTAGTQMVIDINPGAGDSEPRDFTEFNGKIYFTADDGTTGEELWVTDGTAAGTQLVKDINPSGDALDYYGLYGATVYNGKMYFGADDGTNGYDLWVTDGTTAGTQLFKDINSTGDGFRDGLYMTIYNNKMYFGADDGTNGTELWVSDGTDTGTKKIHPAIAPNANPLSHYFSFVEIGGSLYFNASYNSAGRELWKLTTTLPTSITESKNRNSFTLYPNPTDNIIHIEVKKPTAFALYDLQGKLLQSIAPGQTKIDMSGLPSGVYFLTDKNGYSQKVIKN